jgi:hypothetical protein
MLRTEAQGDAQNITVDFLVLSVATAVEHARLLRRTLPATAPKPCAEPTVKVLRIPLALARAHPLRSAGGACPAPHPTPCRAWLQGQGWPEPMTVDSGNGGHVLYRIDLPNDQASTELLKFCLEALAFRFSGNVVMVDCTTYNAGRV